MSGMSAGPKAVLLGTGLLVLLACGASRQAAQGGQSAPWQHANDVGMTNPPPGGALFAGANFWNIDWEGQQDYFRPGVDFATTMDPWRAELIADLRPYRVLRFMDWNDTNAAATIQAHAGTRKPRSATQNQPVAFEWQIDLCNRTDKDCWLNLHHTSNAADWRQAAELAKANLKPSLRLYIEWSNEVWNEGFPQHRYAQQAARQLGLPGRDGAAASYVYQSVRVFEEFARVFADQRQRLVTVLAGQAGWTGPCEAQVAALADPRINPQGIRPDVYAIAPYLGGTSVEELRRALPEVRTWVAAHVKCAAQIGVPLISYEAGTDSSALKQGCVVLQHDPGMREVYVEYLDALVGAGLRGPFMQYTHSGSCWGLKEKTGDSMERSPKYRGLLEWSEKPRAAP